MVLYDLARLVEHFDAGRQFRLSHSIRFSMADIVEKISPAGKNVCAGLKSRSTM
jgi:hypothetical protein